MRLPPRTSIAGYPAPEYSISLLLVLSVSPTYINPNLTSINPDKITSASSVPLVATCKVPPFTERAAVGGMSKAVVDTFTVNSLVSLKVPLTSTSGLVLLEKVNGEERTFTTGMAEVPLSTVII